MYRSACTLLLVGGLSALACSKNKESASAAPAPKGVSAASADFATSAGLTNMLTKELGISEAQATAAVGSVLSLAKGKLSPEDFATLSKGIPGADSFLAAAPDITAAAGANGATPPSDVAAVPAAPTVDSGAPPPQAADDAAAAGANAAAAAGESVGMSALNSAFSKIGLPPEAAKQFVPVLSDYVGKVGGPEAAKILNGLF